MVVRTRVNPTVVGGVQTLVEFMVVGGVKMLAECMAVNGVQVKNLQVPEGDWIQDGGEYVCVYHMMYSGTSL